MATPGHKFKANTLPVDPDVVVPEAVKRAAAAAEAAQKTAYPVDPNAPPAPVDPNAPKLPTDTIVIADPPPQPLPEGVTPTTVVAFTPPATPPATPPIDEASWEARYNSMHGQFKRANSLNQELAARVETLENMMTMTQRAPAATPTTPAAPVERKKLITAQEEADFGPEMIDIMRRAAQEIATPEVEALRATVNDLQGRLQGTTQVLAQDARGRMLAAMDVAMPDWNAVNFAPEFHAWLALPDPYSGVTRKRLLTEAYEANRTPQVLAFFKGFVSELAATQPLEPQVPAPSATPTPPAKPTLQSLAAPGRARTAASVAPAAEKQTIFTSDINAFYAAKRRGAYNGREAEFAAAERELELAMREGRVVTNT